MSEELPRWADHDAPEIYAAARGAYRQLGPDAEQVTRMLGKLELGQTAPAVPKTWLQKPWLWGLPVLSIAALGLFWALHAPPAPPPSKTLQLPAAEPAPPGAAPRVVEEANTHDVQSAESAPAAVPPSTPRLPARARQPAPDPMAELALLARARRVLAATPERALALTDEHRKLYRSGQLAEERELLAIEALVNMGSGGDARRRARSFAKSYPSSVHQHRLGVILDRIAE